MAHTALTDSPQAGRGIFVYRPQPPMPGTLGNRAYRMVCLGINVSRFSHETTASITLRASEGMGVCVFTRSMTAQQCEDFARALLDAAADIRQSEALRIEGAETAAQTDDESSALVAEGGAA